MLFCKSAASLERLLAFFKKALKESDLDAVYFHSPMMLAKKAIKYAKKHIEIVLEKDKLSVISDGKLLSKAELPRLFDRFYQSDKTSEGVGLGLAIAKSLSETNIFLYCNIFTLY